MSGRRRHAAPRLPVFVIAVAAVAVAFVALPFAGLIVRAPWSRMGELASDADTRTALRLSLVTSLAATALAAVLGVPLAWWLARSRMPGRGAVRSLASVSMVLPPVVAGVALLQALGRRGLAGSIVFDAFGVSLAFTTAAVIVAQAFVAMPFLVLTLDAALQSADPGPEEAARTLGALPGFVARHVTLPAVRPALVAGLALAWARALGEFGATITFAGSFPGTTRTVPLETYRALDVDPGRAILLSLVLVVVSVAVLAALRGRWVPALTRSGR